MSGIKYLKAFDKRQLWRFFVDGRFHNKYDGWIGYEAKEKGSIQALLNGFSYVLDNFDLSNGLTSKYILQLHKVCLLNVDAKVDKSTPGELRYLDSGMAMFADISTLDGLKEIFDIRADDKTIIFHTPNFRKTANELNIQKIYDTLQVERRIRYRPWYPNIDTKTKQALDNKLTIKEFYEAKVYIQCHFIDKIEIILNEYNIKIQQAKTDNDKILVISEVVRNLELLHPFPDGNCRVFACILLNHLLLFNNLFPSILHNPNRDGECSYAEFTQDIKKGIENTKSLLVDQDAKLYNYSIQNMSDIDKKIFLDMASELIDKINKFDDTKYNTKENKNIFIDYFILKQLSNGTAYNIKSKNINFTSVVAAFKDVKKSSVYFMTNMPSWIKSGHKPTDVIEKIHKKGARLIIIDKKEYLNKCSAPVLVVDNVSKFMKRIASFVRKVINPKRVLITGTVGKTGFKFQLHHLVSKQVNSHIRRDSGNMEVSICTSILSLKLSDKIEITEVAVGLGGVAQNRSAIVNADISIFTELGECHMDGHKTIENLIRHKSEVVDGMKDDGLCIINSQSPYAYDIKNEILKQKNVPIEFFGEQSIADSCLLDSEFNEDTLMWNIKARIENEFIEYNLPLVNSHAPVVSVGVLLAVKKLGLDVVKASKDYSTFEQYDTMGKVYNITLETGNILFYDQSRRGAIQGFYSAFNDFIRITSKKPGRKIAIIAGTSIYNDTNWTQDQHTQIAELINKANITQLYTIGEYMEYVHTNINKEVQLILHGDTYKDIEDAILQNLENNDNIIIIGHGRHNLQNLSKMILSSGLKYESI